MACPISFVSCFPDLQILAFVGVEDMYGNVGLGDWSKGLCSRRGTGGASARGQRGCLAQSGTRRRRPENPRLIGYRVILSLIRTLPNYRSPLLHCCGR